MVIRPEELVDALSSVEDERDVREAALPGTWGLGPGGPGDQTEAGTGAAERGPRARPRCPSFVAAAPADVIGHPPGYAWFLASVLSLFGRSPLLSHLLQALLSSIAVFLVFVPAIALLPSLAGPMRQTLRLRRSWAVAAVAGFAGIASALAFPVSRA